MNRSTDERAKIALGHIELLREHLNAGPLSEQLVFDAVCMRLSAAIEEASEIDESLLLQTFGDDWRLIKAMRNAIAHGYEFIDSILIGDTIINDLAVFERGLEELAAGRSG